MQEWAQEELFITLLQPLVMWRISREDKIKVCLYILMQSGLGQEA